DVLSEEDSEDALGIVEDGELEPAAVEPASPTEGAVGDFAEEVADLTADCSADRCADGGEFRGDIFRREIGDVHARQIAHAARIGPQQREAAEIQHHASHAGRNLVHEVADGDDGVDELYRR